MDFSKNHSFLDLYLRYTAVTESPKIFHIWCAISAVSACLGKRCWLDIGSMRVYPNMYIVLVGPPGTRKSYAIKRATDLIKRYAQVRFAPNDTGGARQGLISAMTDFKEGDTSDDAIAKILEHETVSNLMKMNGKAQDVVDQIGDIQFDNRDPRTMYIAASELNSIIGEHNTQMLTFLQELYDGGSYSYRLKTTQFEIKDAVLGILGGTTPTQISVALPPESIGQGFTSRIIFVFADRQHARIARPRLDEEAGEKIARIFGTVFDKFEGPFTETEEAAKLHDDIYLRGITLKDPRFTHYADRRQTHLEKTAMALAAGRGSQIVDVIDYEFADELLTATEQTMPDALGEFGLSKLSAAKQKIVEFIRAADKPIPSSALYAMVHNDMSPAEYRMAIAELHNAKKLSYIDSVEFGQCIIGISSGQRQAKREMDLLQTLMTGKPQ